MSLLNLQLKALRYPHPVELSKPESVRKLVIWLENLKIREYKIEDRKALADTQSPSWDAAFKKYLQDLDCPLATGELTAALHWLVAYALSLDYEDSADKLSRTATPSQLPAAAPPAAASAAPPRGGGVGAVKVSPSGGVASSSSSCHPRHEEDFADLHDPRVVTAVMQLVHAAQVAAPEDSRGGGGASAATVVEQLMVAAQRCVCEVGPALRPGVWSSGRSPRQALEGVPLGFEVEGEALSAAATALRLLYIQDLRRLQSQIDHAVMEMQEYTANPKTDSSLGKVGR